VVLSANNGEKTRQNPNLEFQEGFDRLAATPIFWENRTYFLGEKRTRNTKTCTGSLLIEMLEINFAVFCLLIFFLMPPNAHLGSSCSNFC